MPVDPANISRVKIFPPIGIARVGDSGFNLGTGKPDWDTLKYFLPSEIPGDDSVEEGNQIKKIRDFTFREERPQTDGHKRIKRQAVRFRVYAYDDNGKNLGEITTEDGYSLKWIVHVANHKAAFRMFRGMYRQQTDALRNPDVQGGLKPEERNLLIVDPGKKSISTTNTNPVNISGKFHGSKSQGFDVHLGQLRIDEKGHLIFIGGAGYAFCVNSPKPQPDILSAFDSADWIDDVCDGWVKVLVGHGTFLFESSNATVTSAPPKFSWGVRSPTTLYDLIADIYSKQPDNQNWVDVLGGKVNFNRDIWPVLEATYATSWANKDAFDGHGVLGKANYLAIKEKLEDQGQESKVYRQAVFSRLRAPDYRVLAHGSTRYMPRLSGNNGDAIEPGSNFLPGESAPPIQRFAALTALQYQRFSLWKDGEFTTSALKWEGKSNVNDVELEYRPACLTLAALDHTIGEPLYPGIEMNWIARIPGTYVLKVDTDKDRIDPPFRIDHEVIKPGYLTRGLSLPWHCDFDMCNTHWWPTTRPDVVIKRDDFGPDEIEGIQFIDTILPKRKSWSRGIRITPENISRYYPGSTDMIRHWSRLGFLVKDDKKKIKRGDDKDPTWLETEREKIKVN